jgi:hypothetical protein
MTTLLIYDKMHNYIGNAECQYNITKYIYRRCSGVNYTAYIHDNLYCILIRERYLLNKIILKFLFDIQFLLMGIIRSLRNFQIFGILVTFIFYLILLFHSPYYIYYLIKINGFGGL